MDFINSISILNEPKVEHFLAIFVITFGWVQQQSNRKPTQKWWQKWSRNFNFWFNWSEVHSEKKYYLWNRDFSFELTRLQSLWIKQGCFFKKDFLPLHSASRGKVSMQLFCAECTIKVDEKQNWKQTLING